MRVQIVADSVPTKELRTLLAALSKVTDRTAKVRLNGPEAWAVETPMLTPNDFAFVCGEIVKANGVSINKTLGVVRR